MVRNRSSVGRNVNIVDKTVSCMETQVSNVEGGVVIVKEDVRAGLTIFLKVNRRLTF